MFYSLTGTLVYSDTTIVAIDCGGVAFSCSATMNTLKKIGPNGSKVSLFTHLSVRDDSMDLFGFYDKAELDCFKMLITVSGIGPKAALAILSVLEPQELALAIAAKDTKAITKAPGIGPKLAQRIILELKDKLVAGIGENIDTAQIENVGNVVSGGNAAQASEALVMLGYSPSQAAMSVGKLDSTLSVEEMIKLALKELANQ
ncbi:MAG: Holliday junction branch migration protein RuvA [Acutalibacteraceae bacterium]|jgi:Holliday junction DNA helicase RuvA|nr:Holliday junction branch migration protein RuvA [Clostridiales bacterium]